MRTAVADNLIVAITLGLIAVAVWLTCSARRAIKTAESHHDRIVREAHERANLARDLDDMELVRSLAAGCEQLRDAIHNEQQEGEQA